MISRRVLLFQTILMGWILHYSGYAASNRSDLTSFRILSQKADGCFLGYVLHPFSSTTVNIDGQTYTLFPEAQITVGDEGKPQLPVDVLGLGIPFDAAVVAKLVDVEYEVVQNQLIAPRPSHALAEDSSLVPLYKVDASAYVRDAFYPASQLIVESSFTLRQQRMSTIRLFPYQYNPAARTLRRIVKAKIDVQFVQKGSNLFARGAVAGSDPYFEHVYRSLMANYEEAKQWRRPIASSASHLLDSTRNWFQTGRDYYRISIASDGWYRVTKADIVAAGGNPDLLDVSSVKIFARGAEVPVLVRPDSTIEFFAMRKYGDSTYYDTYTDTNTYWLTWGGTPGLRYTTVPQPGGTPSADIHSVMVTKHFEKNLFRYSGTTPDEVVDDGDVPGEGWYWDSYYPTRQIDYVLALDTIDALQGPNVTLRAWFYGITTSSQPPPETHRVRISINQSVVGEQGFAQRTGVLFNATLPAAQLNNGTNEVTIYSVPTTVPVQQFDFDWIEIDYRRFLGAKDNQLMFSFGPAPNGAPVMFTASNFASPQIHVFDLAGRREITGGAITGSVSTGYSIAFKDTLSVSKRYMVVSSPGQLSVPPLQKKQFSDIRVNTLGADYLVITHRNFKTAANQLAAHRHALNGVRTAVIDVQDIYDEFNYGVSNGDSVKLLVKYAYERWPAPAPTYLLIFGDASPDPQKWDPLTTSVNFISGHGGYPIGDNWFACFDDSLTFLPSLLVGRIPVADSVHASRMVAKVMDYESYPVGAWNKSTLAITGPQTLSEMTLFASLSDGTINSYLAPPPLGMNSYRAYRASIQPGVYVDDSKKQYMQDIVNDGVVLVNYLGHAAGQTLALDFGNPHDLRNTNRQWPFVMSVSCNVGAYTTRYGRTLGEDFVLADNRGGIAMWGSSGAGYASAGTLLVNFCLQAVADSIRDFGTLTTLARYRLWQLSPSSYTYILQVKLTPLLGDPLSKLAIPQRPDLALTASAITLERGYAANDSLSTIKVNISNYGLVPPDSVALRLTDTFDGQAFTIVNDKKLAPTRYADSLVVSWDASNQVGRHTLVGTVDPNNMINEVNEMNNASASDKYVYANLLSIVKPFDNMVVPPGSQTLVVTSPFGLDSVGFSYFFELDTVDTFNSTFLVSSGAVSPSIVSGQWTTPSLGSNHVYFWRCRTLYAGTEGNWVTSAFSTSTDSLEAGLVRWRESARRQFARNKLSQSAATDSGVALFKGDPVSISVRSLGARNGSQPDFFSSVSANEYRIDSYPWIWGNGFLVLKVNHLNGQYEVTGYNVPIETNAAGFMNTYISNTVPGDYLAIAAIGDARTNVSEALYATLETLGSQMIRLAQPGQAWAMIAKKGTLGPGMPVIENLTNDSAVVNFLAPLSFGVSPGTISTAGIVTPTSWSAFHWRANTPQGTDLNSVFLGVRSNGVADTLRIIPKDSTDIALDFLNAFTSGSTYKAVKLGGLLSTANEQMSPLLKDWWVDFVPPADLAVSSRTVGALDLTIQRGAQLNLPVAVYNIGFRGVDSARIVVSVFDKFNRARPIASAMLDTIPVNGTKSTTIPISTTTFSRRVTLQVNVSPSKKYKDLVPDNNNAYYTFNVVGATASGIQLFADGVQLMDGDFVAARPKLVVRIPKQEEGQGPRRTEFFIDNKPINTPVLSSMDDQKASVQSGDDLTFTPQLPNGRHELKVLSIEVNSLGSSDTLEQTVDVDVNGQMGILKPYNYPNPFSKETYFTFVLTGDSRPEELHIRIFTIAGRRVQEIVVPQSELVVGFNRVYWDGRDADGDELGNGYYFYKVTIKGQGQTESSIQKLAKIR